MLPGFLIDEIHRREKEHQKTPSPMLDLLLSTPSLSTLSTLSTLSGEKDAIERGVVVIEL